jgi:hypothetical protein
MLCMCGSETLIETLIEYNIPHTPGNISICNKLDIDIIVIHIGSIIILHITAQYNHIHMGSLP